MKKQNLLRNLSTAIILILFFGLIVSSCTNEHKTSTEGDLYYDMADEEVVSDTRKQTSPGFFGNGLTSNSSITSDYKDGNYNNPITPKNLKVIKSGSMQMKVDVLEQAKAEINYLVNKHEAYYSSEKLDHQNYQKVYQLNIRIPSAKYEAFIQELEKKGLGEILDKQITAQDVSEEYVDLETRLKNKRAYIDRYNGLLKQAKNMEDVLKIQEKIRALEEEIDRAQGRLRFLSDRVGYGSLNLMIKQEIEQEVVVEEKDTFLDEFKRSIGYGWSGLLSFILVIFTLWPWLILIAAALIVVRRWRKKRKS